MVGCKINVSKINDREIHNWVESTDITLDFLCLLTYICLEECPKDSRYGLVSDNLEDQ